MKSKLMLIIGLIATVPLFQNCSNGIMASNSALDTQSKAFINIETDNKKSDETGSMNDLTGASRDEIVELYYFHGGWYGLYPNWASDLKLTYINDEVNGTFSAISRYGADSECLKPAKRISEEEQKKIIQLVKGLEIKVISSEGGPLLMDSGSHTLRIKYIGGQERLVSFTEVLAGSFESNFAVNGEALVQYLKALDERLPIVCQ